MLGKCGLAADINRCTYYIRNKEGCSANHKECGFFRNLEIKKKTIYQRKPKWFDQYYK